MKQGATEIRTEPVSKCMWVETQEETDTGTQEETKMGAWMECKMTKALDQLKLVSLKESIIQKAWSDGKRA